ncbi:AAA family ATPase [Pseudarthrobacter sp. BRE9]|uniref:AAA family ATPase n=1 Tax=Pseudarthrobacter sp. BRE9 TaxID=2962582 RepID=UPI002881FAE4|nr:AAA family ATPase [Pseudarthrobacter sp. BRE9]MDT0168509.1 AAA family ATPase [Pseudarthrobacter sp. BRE9]
MITTIPKVFIVIGPAGSGKSSVSQRIAQRFRAAYIDKDTAATGFTELLLKLNGSDPNERDNNEFYQTTIMPLEYATILDLTRDNLQAGNSVVLDAPFGKYFSDNNYLTKIRAHHKWPEAELIVVHVKLAGEALRERLISRGYPRDEWKLANWETFWAGAQANSCHWQGAIHIDFDNTASETDLTAFEAELPRQKASFAR